MAQGRLSHELNLMMAVISFVILQFGSNLLSGLPSEFCRQMSNINNWSGRQLSFDSFLKLFMHGFPEKSGFDARLNFVFWKAIATGFLNHHHRVPRRHNSQASFEAEIFFLGRCVSE